MGSAVGFQAPTTDCGLSCAKVVLAVLITCFAFSVGINLIRLSSGKTGLAVYFDQNEGIQFPSVTLCQNSLEALEGNDGADFWQRSNLLGKLSESILSIHHGTLECSFIGNLTGNCSAFSLTDFANLEIGNHSRSCVVISSHKHSSLGRELTILVDVARLRSKYLDLYTHGRDLFPYTLGEFDLDIDAVMHTTIPNFRSQTNMVYEVKRRKVKRMSTSDRPCDESTLWGSDTKRVDYAFPKCVRQYIEDRLQCSLPFASSKAQLQACNTSRQFEDYSCLLNSLRDDHDLLKTTGCSISCELTASSLRKVADVDTPVANETDSGTLELHFYVLSKEIRVEEEVFLYDWPDLLADIGGILGLLLGASGYSIFSTMIVWWEQQYDKRCR